MNIVDLLDLVANDQDEVNAMDLKCKMTNVYFILSCRFCRDFEKLDYEDEHEQELEGDGPEVRITREQLLSRYQVR